MMTSTTYAICDSARSGKLTGRGIVLLCLVGFIALTGCHPVRQTPPPETRPPRELVAHYLRNVINPSLPSDMYDLLTARARAIIPYREFVFLRSGEISHILGSPRDSDTRISVTMLDQYDVSDDHSVIYALLYIRYPYSIGERETYRLVRLHCHKEGGHWTIEPFMHAETGTVILVPTRMTGPLWRVSRDMEQIQALVQEEIASYEGEKVPSTEESVTSRRQPELASDATVPDSHAQPIEGGHAANAEAGTAPAPPDRETEAAPPPVGADALETETPETHSQKLATQKKVNALLSIGKLCYQAGKIDAAVDTFRRALVLNPEDPVAKDYISRCENYRLLQKEKEEAVRLMEELLRLDSQKDSGK